MKLSRNVAHELFFRRVLPDEVLNCTHGRGVAPVALFDKPDEAVCDVSDQFEFNVCFDWQALVWRRGGKCEDIRQVLAKLGTRSGRNSHSISCGLVKMDAVLRFRRTSIVCPPPGSATSGPHGHGLATACGICVPLPVKRPWPRCLS